MELVLIARGASKALTLRTALMWYCGALRKVLAESKDVVTALEKYTGPGPSDASIGFQNHADKHWRIMSHVVVAVAEMVTWLETIATARYGCERLFVSGARSCAAFVPPGFRDLLGAHRSVAIEHRSVMIAELLRGGWPPSARPRPDEEVHLHPCKVCGQRLTTLWLHRGLCLSCEEKVRSEGSCPYSERCGRTSFCRHERRCFVCEQWSCEQCRILRGDGEDVWQVVQRLSPAAVFLDFDRTLCSTRRGGSPLDGNHTVDPDLASVCASHPFVKVVTRSSRKDDIETFLNSKGVRIAGVRSLKLENFQSKSEVIREELDEMPDSVGLFVDDDIRELTDASLVQLVNEGRLHRVLFVRAGGKE